MNNSEHQNERERTGTLGTFGGVFTPSILTILGIILFLRMGFMVGNAGLAQAIVIISIANLVSLLTSVSMSAAATNIQVKGGGAYYLISRTLGVGFGGSIGIILFLAQSVSIAFYCIGFGEALVAILPPLPLLSVRSVSICAVSLLFLFAWLGADWATKFQYIVMGLLIAALLSFFVGAFTAFDPLLLEQNWSIPNGGLPFWTLFALFFPAVTGFTQGVNMSGDLKDPGKSIPTGTFAAVILSAIIYYGAAFVFAGTMTSADLASDYDAMSKISSIPGFILAGVLAATLSSAMASFLGAPRILQSLAVDKIFPLLNYFATGAGDSNNPRRGVLLSGIIALVVISFGQLNLVAQIVSMFFLISYGLLNYATFYESRSKSIFFRPRFKYFRPWMSLVGFLLCAGAMIAIDVSSGIVAAAIIFSIYQYLKFRPVPARWADSRRSYFLQKALENTRAASLETEHNRDWRPVILALTNDSERLGQLMDFSSWLEGESGTTTAVRFLKGKGIIGTVERKEAAKQLKSHLAELKATAYPLVLTGPDYSEVLSILVQSFGIGPIKANTLLINWVDGLGKGLSGLGMITYTKSLKAAFHQGLNVIILDADLDKWQRFMARNDEQQLIDIWWQEGLPGNFMLLVAYLISVHDSFRNAQIRVIVKKDKKDALEAAQELRVQLEEARIEAEPLIVDDNGSDAVVEISSGSTLVFVPFRIRGHQLQDHSGGSLLRMLPRLPMTALVLAAQDIDLEAEPDDGLLGELAALSDELDEAQAHYRTVFREAEQLKTKADRLTEKLSKLEQADETRAELIAAGDKALREYEKAFRRAAKARIKVDNATRKLEKMTEESG